ncbi:hypothetical protein [Streptomyces sp. NPDC021622]|uniref:hypothetical protein n=1 Tax=Streptomyces sp. NPDC021622 TaxID=3155013 RepID=UPI0033C9A719
MDTSNQGEPLSEDELRLFVEYLHRFCKHDVDLFALLEAGDPEAPAFVTITRDPVAGVERSAYRRP